MTPIARIAAGMQAQRGYLFPFVPISLAFGIGGYFALRFEPGWQVYASLAAVAFCLAAPDPASARACQTGSDDACAGRNRCRLWRGARAHLVAEPVLGWRYYGPVQGRIVNVDRSGSDAVRLTLDRVVLTRYGPRPDADARAGILARATGLHRARTGSDGDPDRASFAALRPG